MFHLSPSTQRRSGVCLPVSIEHGLPLEGPSAQQSWGKRLAVGSSSVSALRKREFRIAWASEKKEKLSTHG